MGNVACVHDQQDNIEWQFVGRKEEIKEAKRLLLKKKSVMISGMKKIGKTRFIKKLLKELRASEEWEGYIFLWKSFEGDDDMSDSNVFTWFEDILKIIDRKNETEILTQYTNKKIQCGSCEECKVGHSRCKKQGELVRSVIDALIKQIKKCEEKYILFLDSVDILMDSPLKDHFLSFYRESLNCLALKTVIASANKPKLTARNFASLELKPLDNDAILKLLYITTEERDNTEEGEIDETVTYAPEFKVFKEQYKLHIKAIVGLCEGLPLAAEMSGMLLTEYDCLLTPTDLVEILICIRLKSLSPENCPPEDRLDIYKRPMKEVKEVEQSFFNRLNESMTDCSFTITEAREATCDENMTDAMVKFRCIKPGLDRSIFITVRSSSDNQKVKWHGIFRECQAALKAIDDFNSDGNATTDIVLRFMRENAKKAGIDFDDAILADPKLLEKAIRSICLQEKTPAPVQESEDHSDERVMDMLKEDLLATEKRTSQGNDTKTSPVVKAHVEIGSGKEVQTPPDADIGNGQNDKTETRYSPQEVSDVQDTDKFKLKFTNREEHLYNTISGVDSPPPYTTLPEPQQAGENYHNQNNGNRYMFQPIQNVPSVEEPPPRYSSTEQFQGTQRQVLESSSHISDHTIPRISSGMCGLRSRSTPSVNSQFIYGDNNEGTNSRQNDSCNLNLRRVCSEPIGNYVESSLSNHADFTPRQEMNTSINTSLTGPPAMKYNPPKVKPTDTAGSQRHNTVSDFHENEKCTKISDASMQCTSHRMNDFKENIPNSLDETSKSVPHTVNAVKGHSSLGNSEGSAFGPAAIAHVNLTHGTNGVKPQTQGQSVENNSRSSLNRSRVDTAKRQSETPTAVVGPMRGMQALSDVSQQ